MDLLKIGQRTWTRWIWLRIYTGGWLL